MFEGTAGSTTNGGSEGANGGSSDGGTSVTPFAGTTGVAKGGAGGVAATGGHGGAVAAGGKSGGGAGGSVAGGAGGAGGKGGASGAGGKGGAGGASGAGGKGGAGGASGSATGGTSGAAGTGGSGGAVSTGHRYAKLVATSELAGNVWSAVAELQIMTTGGVAISRTNWVVMADSEETDDQVAPATAAIDGNTTTFWHTEWEPPPNDVNDAALPHSLIVDMGSAHTVTGFSYLPRQDNQNGRIKGWQFFVSKDGTSWGTAVDTGTFPAGTALQTITF